MMQEVTIINATRQRFQVVTTTANSTAGAHARGVKDDQDIRVSSSSSSPNAMFSAKTASTSSSATTVDIPARRSSRRKGADAATTIRQPPPARVTLLFLPLAALDEGNQRQKRRPPSRPSRRSEDIQQHQLHLELLSSVGVDDGGSIAAQSSTGSSSSVFHLAIGKGSFHASSRWKAHEIFEEEEEEMEDGDGNEKDRRIVCSECTGGRSQQYSSTQMHDDNGRINCRVCETRRHTSPEEPSATHNSAKMTTTRSGDEKLPPIHRLEISSDHQHSSRQAGQDRSSMACTVCGAGSDSHWDRDCERQGKRLKLFTRLRRRTSKILNSSDRSINGDGGANVYAYEILIVSTTILADRERHLSFLPDETFLGDLMLPGTHESMALHGWPFSQCQSPGCSLQQQLKDGIRFFDIRLAVRDGVLRAYHGRYPQLVPFKDMLATIALFLQHHPRETLIFCVQQEAPTSPDFSALCRSGLEPYNRAGYWFLENRVPTLGEVRGRAIWMSRFGRGQEDGGDTPWLQPTGEVDTETGQPILAPRMGWRPERWPNNVVEGFDWHCGKTETRTQDWYDIQSIVNIRAKFNTLTDHLLESARSPSGSNLTLSFASAAAIPLALPPWVANGFGFPSWGSPFGIEGVNSRLQDWLVDRLAEILEDQDEGRDPEIAMRGIVPLDFYSSSSLIDIMLSFNVL